MPLIRAKVGLGSDISESGDTRYGIKLFLCMFHRGAFLTQTWDAERRTFHEFALAEARQYEERVSQDLGGRVFATVFPGLANALAHGERALVRAGERADSEDAPLALLSHD